MKLVPIGDCILVKRTEPEGKSKGGILLPDVAKDKPRHGKVVATGAKVEAADIKAGATLYFRHYGGNELEADGQEYVVVKEEDVLAVLV